MLAKNYFKRYDKFASIPNNMLCRDCIEEDLEFLNLFMSQFYLLVIINNKLVKLSIKYKI